MNQEQIKTRILSILIQVGEIKKPDLLDQFPLGLKERTLRKIIEQMVKEGYAVGSCHRRGYFLIRNQQDFDDAFGDLKARYKSLIERANALHKSFYKTEMQLSLFEA